MTQPPIRIPFNRPTSSPRTMTLVAESFASGHLSGDGPASRRCASLLAGVTGSERVLLTPSCTAALEMAALLLDLEPGDEVIIPSFAFVSTVNAFVLHGAQPRFADVRSDTLNLDEAQLSELVGPRTRAIVALHYAGVAFEMDTIGEFAADHDLLVIEDAAHALFGRYRGRPLGGIGDLGTLSFHETKNITCGEGGALLINRPDFIERAEIIREKGTNRSQFSRGEADRYTWLDLGSSYLLADPLAAALVAQLEDAERIQTQRRAIWELYESALTSWAAANAVQLPFVPDECEHPAHLFFLLFPTGEARDRCLEHLRDRGILGVFHYLPLHISPMGRRFGGQPGECPVTESVAERLVRLPLHTDLRPIEREDVIEAVLEFSC